MAPTAATQSEPDWLLVMGDRPLAALWYASSNQPWHYCAFEPTPDFEAIRPLLEAITQAVDIDDIDSAEAVMDELAAMDVRLIWPDGTREPRPDAEGSLQIDGHQIKFRPA
jgi:hypothetical protein